MILGLRLMAAAESNAPEIWTTYRSADPEAAGRSCGEGRLQATRMDRIADQIESEAKKVFETTFSIKYDFKEKLYSS